MNTAGVPPDRFSPRSLRPPWWRELAMIAGFYAIYTIGRNQFGSAAVGPDTAYRNAAHIIDIERALGLYQEARIQDWFITYTSFIQFWNLFYGTFHFAVTAGVLLYLYKRHPQSYQFWRTAGLLTTALALVGFAVFPLMPPRLLGDCGQ